MNWFKRALLSLWGHKGRSILLIFVFGILAMIIYCGLAVHSAAEQEIKNAKERVGAVVTLKGKTVAEKMESGGVAYCPTEVPTKLVNKLRENKMVKSCNYYILIDAILENIAPVCDQAELDNEADAAKKFNEINPGKFTFVGVTDSSRADQFTAGGYKLIAGRHITSDDAGKPTVLIEQELALKNNLKVGSRVTVWQAEIADQHKMEATVVGIFHAAPADDEFSVCCLRKSNCLFTSYTNVYQIDPRVKDTVIDANYQLDDPEKVGDFSAWCKRQIDNSKFELATNEIWYKRMTGALGSVSSLTNLLTIVAILAACAIMGLISVMVTRGRRREIGVLLSIGEKRRKIVWQIILEALIPVCISFCVALFAGGLLAPLAGDMLLSRQVQSVSDQTSTTDTKSTLPTYRFKDPLSEWNDHRESFAQPVDKITTSVSTSDAGGLAAISLLIVLVSTIASCETILRLSPSQVLNKKE